MTTTARKVMIRLSALISAAVILASLFSCGRILIIDWSIKNDVLTVRGASAIEYERYPWSMQRDDFSELIIKDGVLCIGSNAFSDCDKLEKVTVPSTVEFIGSNAFSGCDSLSEVLIYAKMDSVNISKDAFDNPDVIIWLNDVGDDTSNDPRTDSTDQQPQPNIKPYPEPYEYNTTWSCADGILFIDGCGSMDRFARLKSSYMYDTPWVTENLYFNQVVFGSQVTHISEGAFFRMYNLEKVEIPSNIVYIGKEAFDDCSSLKSLKLNDGLIYIDDYAFSGIGIETLIIPSTVVYIGCSAFDYCDSLKHVIIENTEGLVEIGEFAFPEGCKVTFSA